MRAGACTVQQTLTSEAASVLKHSLSLARRRGHAQVTPLHVAATLLSSRASLLRRACLKSQPHHNNHHPLYSRALELCFNVALNRLPTTPGPLLHGQPSLSNALIAALKRAQAHQRRGCIEQQQQQPLLAIKVELEQLILSILDDPSVSRVMREAGFSSTAVKNNLEDSPVFPSYNTTSGGVYSSPCSPTQIETQTHTGINLFHPHFSTYSPDQNHSISPHSQTKHSDDIKLVLEVLLRKKRNNTVIVGDSVSITEGLVHQLMGKISRGDMDVPNDLKSVHFIKFHFSSLPLRFMRREEVELNLSDLKKKVDSLGVGGRGVIIYTGDMKWTVYDSSFGDGYSPVDHLVNEIGKLVTEYGNSNTKVWLMATANYQTYMRCQMRQPPLEIQWGLQAVSVPSGGLGLSLNVISVHESRMTFSQNPSQLHERKPLTSKEEQDMATCCAECTANYEKEAAMFKAGHYKPSSLYSSPCKPKNMDNVSNNLPSWLQSHGSEVLERDELANLRRKWNTLCRNLHHERHTHNHNINSSLPNYFSYPWWPNSNPNSPLRDTNSISFTDSTLKPSLPRFRRQQSCHIEFSFTNMNNKEDEPNLDSLKTSEEGKELKITLALGNGNSLSSDNGKIEDLRPKDRDYICSVLLDNVHWHLDSIPLIAESLVKKDTWFLFEGNDSIGKRRLGRAIAKAVFGSADLLFSMNTRRETEVEKLEKALVDHEKLVVLVEDIDFADNHLVKFLGDQLEAMKIGESNKRERICGEKIFILTKGDHPCDGKKIRMKLEVNEGAFGNKRRAEWNLLKENKIPKINDKNDESHSHALDLNIKADEDEERDNEEEDHGEFSPNSSDLTRENAVDLPSQLRFLKPIRNRFVFNRDSDMDSQLRDMFLSRITDSFERVFGGEEMAGCFTAEKGVLEEVLLGCGSFLNGLFEKWLKDIFQTSLQTVKIGGKGVSMRLCLGGEGGIESGLDDVGFMGSNLPKKIQVSFMH